MKKIKVKYITKKIPVVVHCMRVGFHHDCPLNERNFRLYLGKRDYAGRPF